MSKERTSVAESEVMRLEQVLANLMARDVEHAL